jgi:hypothetical protein
MDKFKEELFLFCIKEQNFQLVYEVAENFDFFKRKLLDDFWADVVFGLKQKSKEIDGWNSWKENEVIKGSSYIAGIYGSKHCPTGDSYASVTVSYFNYGDGRVMYGLNFNESVSKDICTVLIKELNTLEVSEWKVAPKNWAWQLYKFTGENFNNYNSLVKVLPERKEVLVKEYINNLVNTYKVFKDFIDKYGVKY